MPSLVLRYTLPMEVSPIDHVPFNFSRNLSRSRKRRGVVALFAHNSVNKMLWGECSSNFQRLLFVAANCVCMSWVDMKF